MNRKRKQHGLTLTELVVVVAVIAILLGISVPTAQKIMDSFEHSAGARGLIDAALSSARAMAVNSNGEYVGVRFQQDKNGDFYMIFIIHDAARTGRAQGFMAVPNKKPLKLPKSLGIMDSRVASDADLQTSAGRMDLQTFSIVFSPQGQLILYEVRAWNRDGAPDDSSLDPIFNTGDRMVDPVQPAGMFLQDGNPPTDGLWQEYSIRSFYIYDKKRLQEAGAAPYTGYIRNLQPEFVNPYTGQLVKK